VSGPMPLPEKDEEELIRRRLVDSVKADVEKSLFRYYRNALGIVLATLTVVGVAVGWPTLRGFIESAVDKRISQIVEQKVTEPVAKAEEYADRAADIIQNSVAGFDAQRSILTDSLAKLHNASEDIGLSYAKLGSRVEALSETAQGLEQKATFFTEEYKTSLVTREELRDVQASINSLLSQTQELSAAVQDLAQALDRSTPAAAVSRELASIAEQTSLQVAQQQPLALPEGTVFVQFAGGDRNDIVELRSLLEERGWQVPGEERIASAAGKREVRYFHDSDDSTADALVGDINAALRSLKLDISVKKSPLFDYPKKPRPGIFELWLEIPLR